MSLKFEDIIILVKSIYADNFMDGDPTEKLVLRELEDTFDEKAPTLDQLKEVARVMESVTPSRGYCFAEESAEKAIKKV